MTLYVLFPNFLAIHIFLSPIERLKAILMSAGSGSSAHFDRIREVRPFIGEPGALFCRAGPQSLEEARGAGQGRGTPPLPLAPSPVHLPLAAEFYPSDSDDSLDATNVRPLKSLIPSSVKDLFRGSKGSLSEPKNNSRTNLSIPGSNQGQHGVSGGSCTSQEKKEGSMDPISTFDDHTVHTGLTYEERLAQYRQIHGYMRTWAGLLRILGSIELLLGAAVFACVCAYIYKDNEWYNMFGYSQSYSGYSGMGMPGGGMGSISGMSGGGMSGVYYTGPQTPFVLVVAGLAWLVTVILLVLGMTMYYRTVLLDSNFWPLTEFFINLVLAVLYLAAAIVYVRDTLRGGLCYYPYFNNGMTGGFCRTEAGQTAGIIFLFLNTLVYLVSAIVCIKLQRHEAARMRREYYQREVAAYSGPRSLKPILLDSRAPTQIKATRMEPQVKAGHAPSLPPPKPVILPDYVEKYPSIRTDVERDRYKAVFRDQHAEYKELNAEVQAVLKRFNEMDRVMRNLHLQTSSQTEQERLQRILQEYERKKTDPAFLEKKERCTYLKAKLSHIKQKIQEYDNVTNWKDGYK
uniref:MARVEL domain containing 2b n=1 Tax=Paramormyrops kingsleyae TaxID=1676925 RepID=A0A3B3SZ72_9TELE